MKWISQEEIHFTWNTWRTYQCVLDLELQVRVHWFKREWDMLGKRNSRAKDTSFWKTVKDFQAMTAERHSCKGPCLEAFQVLGWVFPGCYGPCSLRSYDLKEDDTDQNRAGMQCEGETWVRDAGKQVWWEGGWRDVEFLSDKTALRYSPIHQQKAVKWEAGSAALPERAQVRFHQSMRQASLASRELFGDCCKFPLPSSHTTLWNVFLVIHPFPSIPPNPQALSSEMCRWFPC